MTGSNPKERGESVDPRSADSPIDHSAWEQFAQPGDSADAPESSADSVESLQSQLQEAEEKALRYQAELDNFRRRTRRELEEQLKYACLPLINELLEVQDNLQRALDAVTETAPSSLAQGVQMVAMQLTTLLESKGCQRIETIGCPFDPNAHQAAQMQFSREVAANHVIGELRAGYRLHERVIRPAQVVISKGAEA